MSGAVCPDCGVEMVKAYVQQGEEGYMPVWICDCDWLTPDDPKVKFGKDE